MMKSTKNSLFIIDSGPTPGFPVSSPRTGASHHLSLFLALSLSLSPSCVLSPLSVRSRHSRLSSPVLHVDARGKPSTVFPRGGLVETEPKKFRCDILSQLLTRLNSLQHENIEKHRLSDQFSRKSANAPDLNLVQSFATEFSWTSRFQNLKLHAFILNLTASHENR